MEKYIKNKSLVRRIMEFKNIYRKLCSKNNSIPFFSRDIWLDSACGEDNWDVVLCEENDQVVGALPYYKSKRAFFNLLGMPPITLHLGPWLKYPTDIKYRELKSFEIKIMSDLINNLPQFDIFDQNFHHSITNWLPFYWNGFSQTTHYTHIFTLDDLDDFYSGIKREIRKNIKKASDLVSVVDNLSLENFYSINKMSFDRQKLEIPYSFNYLKKIDDKLVSENKRKIFFAIDKKDNIHAVLYVIWDNNSSYLLLSGADPIYRDSCAQILLNWEAAQFTKNVLNLQKLDCCGSMIKNIAKIWRDFGAVEVPYFKVTKSNSKSHKILVNLQGFGRLREN